MYSSSEFKHGFSVIFGSKSWFEILGSKVLKRVGVTGDRIRVSRGKGKMSGYGQGKVKWQKYWSKWE